MADRRKAREFARRHRKTRRDPEVLVGREEEVKDGLDDLRNTVDPELRKQGKERQDGITLFRGPPGSGKTTLLFEIRRRALADRVWEEDWKRPKTRFGRAWRRLGRRLGRKPLFVMTTPDKIPSMRALFNACILAARPWAQDPVPEETGKGIAVTLKSEDAAVELKNVNFLTRWVEKQALRIRPAIVVMVDEVQDTTPANRAAYSILQNATTGYGFTPIFAGLSDSFIQIKRSTGSSRFSVREMGRLSDEESAAVIEGALEKITFTPGEIHEAVRRGVESSNGFPQHLTSFTVAVAKHCEEKDGGLTAQDWEAIEDSAREKREEYYAQRGESIGMSPEEGELVARLIDEIVKPGATPETVLKAPVEELAKKMGDESLNARTFLRRLVHAGILENDAKKPGAFVEGIPSFTSWIKETYGPPATMAPPGDSPQPSTETG